MSELLQFLQQRNSAPKLTAPAPSAEELEGIYRAALRAPDHAWLRPWRFITIAGDRRQAFGELLEQCLVQRSPDADEAARAKARNAPLRAPMLVVPVVTLVRTPESSRNGTALFSRLCRPCDPVGGGSLWLCRYLAYR